jgi:hypothetical protein
MATPCSCWRAHPVDGSFDAPELDFFAGMDDDEASEWRRTQDEDVLIGPMYQEIDA